MSSVCFALGLLSSTITTLIIDYLLYSNKIAVDKERKIGWTWNPKLVKKYLSKPELKWIG